MQLSDALWMLLLWMHRCMCVDVDELISRFRARCGPVRGFAIATNAPSSVRAFRTLLSTRRRAWDPFRLGAAVPCTDPGPRYL